jgi:hypothetical protein
MSKPSLRIASPQLSVAAFDNLQAVLDGMRG